MTMLCTPISYNLASRYRAWKKSLALSHKKNNIVSVITWNAFVKLHQRKKKMQTKQKTTADTLSTIDAPNSAS
jgi:hypothetical protein